ncbi:MAG: AAA family ATPase [Bacteroidaceae bacterium]|nr:AAA family ATPase [Bacteroidaceae bacterium]
MGQSQIKEFFIYKLGLNDSNLEDYFAIYKTPFNEYFLYYVPKLLYRNFIQLFKSTVQEVSVERANRNITLDNQITLQRIFYGAPGTGKSHVIKENTKGKEVIRTTFHPDSDYSTFVGAYKPTAIEVPMRDVTGKIIVENGKQVTEKKIVYEFVEQAFLQAYIKAWNLYAETEEGKTAEEVYLVIEEINRGNCAQIFGDLFQLLDRGDDGFSEYPIVADKDLQKQLEKSFADIASLNVPAICDMSADVVAEKIKKGEILLLPSNLLIWATMNTSDQSLFPIDSAFKRRWDWQYVPIANGNKKWKIVVNKNEYDWWEFLEKINALIGEKTSSEDKKMGYYFCKATNDVIDAKMFVGKVIFYLWNDVFKDYDFEGDAFNDDDGSKLIFGKFYTTTNGTVSVVEEKVELFLSNLGIAANPKIEAETPTDEEANGDFKVKLDEITFNERTAIETFAKVVESIGVERVAGLNLKVSQHPLLSKDKLDPETPGGYGLSMKQIGDYWMVCKFSNDQKVRFLQQMKDQLDLDLEVVE